MYVLSDKKHIIQILESAIYECYTAPEDPNKGYAYATGYAKETLREVLEYMKKQ
jgi:hypothetical protein